MTARVRQAPIEPPVNWMLPLNLRPGRISRWKYQQHTIRSAIVDFLISQLRAAGGPKAIRWRDLNDAALLMLEQAEHAKHGRWKLASSLATTAVGKLADEVWETENKWRWE